MKNTNNNIKKENEFVRTTFAPNEFLCIEEVVIDVDTNEPYYWATDKDGGEFEVAPEEIIDTYNMVQGWLVLLQKEGNG